MTATLIRWQATQEAIEYCASMYCEVWSCTAILEYDDPPSYMHNQNCPSCALIKLYAKDKTFEYPSNSMQHQNVTFPIVGKRGRVTLTVTNCKIRSKGLSFGISTITIRSLVQQYQSTKIRNLSSNPTFKLKTTESTAGKGWKDGGPFKPRKSPESSSFIQNTVLQIYNLSAH